MSFHDTTPRQAVVVGPLAENHLADLYKSGLSDTQIAACGFVTVTRSNDVAAILKWKQADKLGACLAIPYRGPDGTLIPLTEFARLKPDKPRTSKTKDGSPGKPVRYESPKGSTVRLYFPPATWAKLADPTVPLIVTEGEKKSAKADQEGFACIGLGGVDAWSRKRAKGPDGKSIGKRELISDFGAVALARREVFIVFDSDLAEKPAVQWAEWNFSQALAERGVVVKVVRLPNGPPGPDGKPTKIGLDDFLVAHTADEFRELLNAAQEPRKPERQDDRVEVHLSTDEAVVNEAVIRALSRDETLYQRAGKLVHVVAQKINDGIDRPDDVPRVLTMSLAGLRERLTQAVRFVVDDGGDSQASGRTPRPLRTGSQRHLRTLPGSRRKTAGQSFAWLQAWTSSRACRGWAVSGLAAEPQKDCRMVRLPCQCRYCRRCRNFSTPPYAPGKSRLTRNTIWDGG